MLVVMLVDGKYLAIYAFVFAFRIKEAHRFSHVKLGIATWEEPSCIRRTATQRHRRSYLDAGDWLLNLCDYRPNIVVIICAESMWLWSKYSGYMWVDVVDSFRIWLNDHSRDVWHPVSRRDVTWGWLVMFVWQSGKIAAFNLVATWSFLTPKMWVSIVTEVPQ